MNCRYYLLLAGLCAALTFVPTRTFAQRAEPTVTISSAKFQALDAAGTVRDVESGAEVVAQAIIVKMKPGYGSAVRVVGTIAAQADLQAAAITPLAFSTIPLEKDLQARLQSLPSEQRQRIEQAEEEIGRIVELHYTAKLSPRAAAARMMRFPGVEYAEPIALPEVFASPTSPNDPRIPEQGHLSRIKAFEAWEIWQGDTNMVIGIVDAGIDMDHEDLAPNIKENLGEYGVDGQGNRKETNRIDDDNNGAVDDFRGANLTTRQDGSTPGQTRGIPHGTAVAGMASAATDNGIGIAGVGNQCRFFPVKGAHKTRGTLSAGYEGVLYCARRGFKVVNCSWGGAFSRTNEDIIRNVIEAYDVAIVAAAGNDPNYGVKYPGGFRGVFGVGALDPADGFFTTWGESVDISAPVGLTTVQSEQNPKGEYWPADMATSYAAPVVSGALGLVRSKFPALTALQAIAHVRLTADTIDYLTANREKARLIGYGRLNVLRALTTDPFSHPAVIVDSLWTTDPNGVAKSVFNVGEPGKLHLRLKNLLGDATNLRVRIVAYTSDSALMSLGRDAVTLAELKTLQTATLAEGIPFELTKPIPGYAKFRIEITADGDYRDYHYEKLLLYLPFMTMSTPKITVSLTDKGRLGADQYPDSRVGDELTYEGVPYLYEGGFIVSSDRPQVISNIRGALDGVQDADFTAIDYPSPANNYTLTLSDKNAEEFRRIGVELRVRLVKDDAIPNAIGVEVRARNTGSAMLDTLRLGLFNDWDIEGDGDNQTVNYVPRPGENVPFYGIITGPSGHYVATGVAAPAEHPIFWAIENGSEPVNIFQGFDVGEKWLTVSNGVGSPSAGPTDISLVSGNAIPNLMPGAEDTVLFVIGIAGTRDSAVTAMRTFAPSTSTSVVDAEIAGTRGIAAVTPNPFSTTTQLTVTASRESSTLRVFDAYGRMVADLSNRLPLVESPVTISFDAHALPSGMYYLRLTTAGHTESRTLLLVR